MNGTIDARSGVKTRIGLVGVMGNHLNVVDAAIMDFVGDIDIEIGKTVGTGGNQLIV